MLARRDISIGTAMRRKNARHRLVKELVNQKYVVIIIHSMT
jgi:hypothetical protein